MIAMSFVGILLMAMPVSEDQSSQNSRESARPTGPSRTITARAPSLGNGQTRVICEREKTMDSNIPRRVCREVLVNSAQRERMGTDMTREMQRLPYEKQ